MDLKSNCSVAEAKEILDAHEKTLMKFFNTAIEILVRKVDKWERRFKKRHRNNG